jgi:hypothetical protein
MLLSGRCNFRVILPPDPLSMSAQGWQILPATSEDNRPAAGRQGTRVSIAFAAGAGNLATKFFIPLPNPLLEDCEMFRVRHCRVTSIASGMLRMTLEGHTLCDPPRPVNAEDPSRFFSAQSDQAEERSTLSPLPDKGRMQRCSIRQKRGVGVVANRETSAAESAKIPVKVPALFARVRARALQDVSRPTAIPKQTGKLVLHRQLRIQLSGGTQIGYLCRRAIRTRDRHASSWRH